MISFDVKSLFTNVTRNLVKQGLETNYTYIYEGFTESIFFTLPELLKAVNFFLIIHI